MAPLSAEKIATLIIIERVSASISVTATLTLFTVYAFIPEFRTISNTLIFYASFANLFANVAALIGGSALSKTSGGLCQFQAFLLEMFMQSDPMWSLMMAVNVYLVFFRRWDARRLKSLSWKYAIVCYGVPFIPALFCLIYKTKAKGEMYGNATLWCWIDNDWAVVRIYSYYGPIWIYILVTFIIYIRVGWEIFTTRSALQAFGSGGQTHTTLTSSSAHKMNNRNSWRSTTSVIIPEPFTGIRTTEVEVTHTQNNLLSPAALYSQPTSGQRPGNCVEITTDIDEGHRGCLGKLVDVPRNWLINIHRRMDRIDNVKWAYTKVALLFAASILVTWVPASVNRVYGLFHQADPSFGTNVASAIVLPLQGFWNSVIFFSTSVPIIKSTWREYHRRKPTINATTISNPITDRGHLGSNFGHKEKDSESTREVLDDEMEMTSADNTRNNSISERATSSG